MLKRLQVSNFQRIAKSDIPLEGINLIVGPNGSGKTSHLRALRALCFNRRGDDFIRKGEDEAMVLVTCEDGGVGWSKERKKSALYDLLLRDNVDEGEKSQQWSKTGTSVPDEVREFLHIGPIEIEKGFTITPQFPGPLNRDILAESGSRQARIIGVLTRLDVVVNAQRAARTDKTTATGQQDQAQLEVDRANTLLEGLTWVEPMREKLTKIEQLFQQIDKAQTQLDDGRAIINALIGVRVTLAREEDVTKAKQLLDQAQGLAYALQPEPIKRWQVVQAALTTEAPVTQARKLMPQARDLGDILMGASPLLSRWAEVEPILARTENVAQAHVVFSAADPLVETLGQARDLTAQRAIVLIGLERLGKERDESQDAFNVAQQAYVQACDDHDLCDHCPFHKNPMEATA